MFKKVINPRTGEINDDLVATPDGLTFIPKDEGNADWRKVKDWLAEGNELAAPDPLPTAPADAPPTLEEKVDALISGDQAKIDAVKQRDAKAKKDKEPKGGKAKA